MIVTTEFYYNTALEYGGAISIVSSFGNPMMASVNITKSYNLQNNKAFLGGGFIYISNAYA